MLRKHHHQQHILYIYIHKQKEKKCRDEEEFQVVLRRIGNVCHNWSQQYMVILCGMCVCVFDCKTCYSSIILPDMPLCYLFFYRICKDY